MTGIFDLGNAEVDYLNLQVTALVTANHDIFWLQITVKDSNLVGRR